MQVSSSRANSIDSSRVKDKRGSGKEEENGKSQDNEWLNSEDVLRVVLF